MKHRSLTPITIALFAGVTVLSPNLFASDDFLPTATPESQGIPSEAVLEYVQAAEADADKAAHSFIIVRNGYAVAEGYWTPYAKNQPHELFSLSKSFTSTAVGLAVSEGLLSIDDRVIDFFPDSIPDDANDNLKNMRVRQLLSMSTGHLKEPQIWTPVEGTTVVQRFLKAQPELQPGTYFLYNTPATYMQSAIVQKLTGQRVRDYLMPRLFEPLGIEQPNWDQSEDGVDYGGFGLYLKTRDIAKFGQLLLQKGKWEGQQLVPAEWLAMANSKQVSNGASPDNDWNAGYGFQFWMNSTQGFRGDGAFGQLCIVLPKANMVVAMTAATQDMGQEMRWIWDILLPALSDKALPENKEAQSELKAKLDSLVLAMPEGDAIPAESIANDTGTYMLEDNMFGVETARVHKQGEQLTLELGTSEGGFSLPIGHREWKEAQFIRSNMFGQPDPSKAFISGAWETPTKLNISIVYEGRCQMLRMAFDFSEGITIQPSVNVAFGPTEFPAITGTRVE